MLAYILEGEIEPIADLVSHHGGYRDAAWLGDALDPRRDIDAVAIDVTVLENDVADIHPDAKLDSPLFRHIDVPFAHLTLYFRCAGYRIYHAWELDQHSVAGELNDPPLVLGNPAIDQFLAVRLQGRQRTRLISAHESAIADHVGS